MRRLFYATCPSCGLTVAHRERYEADNLYRAHLMDEYEAADHFLGDGPRARVAAAIRLIDRVRYRRVSEFLVPDGAAYDQVDLQSWVNESRAICL